MMNTAVAFHGGVPFLFGKKRNQKKTMQQNSKTPAMVFTAGVGVKLCSSEQSGKKAAEPLNHALEKV